MIEKPEKIYPCDCCAEGITMTVFECMDAEVAVVARDGEDEDRIPYYALRFAFWGEGVYDDNRPNWWQRLRLMWYVWKHGHGYVNMVAMTPKVAKQYANHILYRVDQIQKKIDQKPDELKDQSCQDDIKWPENDQIPENSLGPIN